MSDGRDQRLGVVMAGLLFFKLVINTTQRAIYPFLPAIARGLGISLPAAGAMVSVRWATGMATPMLIGTAGRRRPSSALMLMGGLVFTIGSIITAASGVFIGALIGFGLLGIGKPIFDIGSQGFISEKIPFGSRARYLGLMEVAWAGGLLVGAPVFGYLIDRYDWTTPFWVVGIVAGLGTLVIAFSRRKNNEKTETVGPKAPLSLTRPAVAFLAAGALMSLGIELTLVILGEWLEGFGLTIVALGGVGVVLGVAELIGEGGVLAFTDRIGARRAMQIGAVGMGLGFSALAFIGGSKVLALATLSVTILLFEFGIVSAISLATEMRPLDRHRFLAVYVVTSAVGRMVADWTGPSLFAGGGIARVAIGGVLAAGLAFGLVTAWVELPSSSGSEGPGSRVSGPEPESL